MTTALFKKLNLQQQDTVHVLDAPASFESELALLQGVRVLRSVEGPVRFALAFVTTLQQVEQATAALMPSVQGDVVLWMAYPKASSRRLRCEFNRDTGWQALGKAGYEPVRQVAVDEDWSALRFRHAAFIPKVRRHPDGALSAEGRRKAEASRESSR